MKKEQATGDRGQVTNDPTDPKNETVSTNPIISLRDSENTDITVMAPGFGSDFVVLIEQNRRHSSATARILRLRHGEKWPEDGMLEWDIGIFRVPKSTKQSIILQSSFLALCRQIPLCSALSDSLR